MKRLVKFYSSISLISAAVTYAYVDAHWLEYTEFSCKPLQEYLLADFMRCADFSDIASTFFGFFLVVLIFSLPVSIFLHRTAGGR